MNILSTVSNDVEAKVIADYPLNIGQRCARFNFLEPLKTNTYEIGESKQLLPIISQCLVLQDNLSNRRYMKHKLFFML